MAEETILRGSVASVLFQNQENGYTVLRFDTEGGDDVTVVGTIPMAAAGETLAVTGHWENHPAHGPQFRAEFLERVLPAGSAAIEKYLASRVVKGIGPLTAKRIVQRFGDQTLEILEREPLRLREISGISEKKALEIGESFSRQFGMRKLLEFLLQSGLPPELAMPLYRTYGDLAEEALLDNPYVLTDDFFGVPFAVADTFAIAQGVEAEDERRVEAACVYTLRHNLQNGHTFLPADKLVAATATMLSIDKSAAEAAFARLQEAGQAVCDEMQGVQICYLPEYYEAETYIAQRLLDLGARTPEVPAKLENTVHGIERDCGITYAKTQVDAICLAARSTVMALTGGPGTGKTTTLGGILQLFDRLELKTVLAAPTGRAAQRMTELCGREATTIHRLLEPQFSQETGKLEFLRDESEPLRADAVVVDETSMVDLLLMEALLRALRPDCRLILVGDADQLPSVGAGNLFSDILRSGAVPTVRLTEVFRQAQESLIIVNAHRIDQGQLPDLAAKNRDFFFLPRGDADRLVETIADLCARRLPEKLHIPATEIQVLCPTRKTEVGTANLNIRLQAALNPPAPDKQERKHGSVVFREGDRVMQIRNNYDIVYTHLNGFGMGTGVFNGDVGRIETISTGDETMTVAFDDKRVEYPFDQLGQLELAYAMTVHKSQGSEYRAVILTAWRAHPNLLTRSILYTAVTRARELLIVVGDPAIVEQMVENDRRTRRYSGLKLRLERREAK